MCVLWILTRLKNSLGLYLSTTWRHVTIFHSTFYDLIYMENGKYCPVLSQFFEQQKVIFYRNIRWHYLKCPFEHWIEIPYLVNSSSIGHITYSAMEYRLVYLRHIKKKYIGVRNKNSSCLHVQSRKWP